LAGFVKRRAKRRRLRSPPESTLVFEGDGRIGDYVGGYADWVREKEKVAIRAAAALRPAEPIAAAKSKGGRRLTNKERREIEELPAKIDSMEKEQAELGAKMSDPIFYQRERSAAAGVKARLDELERQHAAALARWEELEAVRERQQTKLKPIVGGYTP
jgi:ATP-binding cassette subfamily F protein uup